MSIHEEDVLGKAYDARLMRRLLTYLRPYTRQVGLATTDIVGHSALELAPPYLVKLVIDTYIPSRDLEGLTLVTGRHVEAGYILRTFAHYVRDGLIPNMFPEREKEGLYHTADATMWFFHAVQRYIDYTGDRRDTFETQKIRALLRQLKRDRNDTRESA